MQRKQTPLAHTHVQAKLKYLAESELSRHFHFTAWISVCLQGQYYLSIMYFRTRAQRYLSLTVCARLHQTRASARWIINAWCEKSAPIIFCNKLECSVNCERADARRASIHCFVANGAAVGKPPRIWGMCMRRGAHVIMYLCFRAKHQRRTG